MADELAHARDAEVGDLGPAGLVEQDVLGFDVPMHQPLGVGVGEPVADLKRHANGVRGLERQPLGERPARHPLHDQIALARVRGAEVVNPDDVRVSEQAEGAGFPGKAGLEGRVGGQLGRQELDRNRTVEPHVARPEHPPHAAAADELLQHQTGRRRGRCVLLLGQQASGTQGQGRRRDQAAAGAGGHAASASRSVPSSASTSSPSATVSATRARSSWRKRALAR